MAQSLTTSFVVTHTPGAYSQYTVQNSTLGFAANGIVAIVGEADGGISYSTDVTKNNYFGPDQLDAVVRKYTSGQIVDAFRALSSPSNDTGITGAPNRIYIVKTNTGTSASATLATAYGSITQKVVGVIGNNTQYKVTSAQTEVAPVITSTAIPAFGAPLNNASFTIRTSGGSASVITLSAVAGNHSDIATLVVELNALLTAASVPVTASASGTTILVLTYNADALANTKGSGKSIELYESTPANLAKFGLVAGLFISSVEPMVNLLVSNTTTDANETLTALADVVLSIGYQGTTATLTTTATTLTTTVVGGAGGNLSVNFSQFTTLSDLANWINTQTGYSASVSSAGTQLPLSALDIQTALPICSSGTGIKAGRLKRGLYAFKQAMLGSNTVNFTATATAGLPTVMTNYAFLTSGARGSTSGTDVLNAVATLSGVATNFVVPLFSQDATADITAGVTDPASTYTISAINATVKSHVLAMSTPIMKRNRQAILSYLNTFANAQAQAQSTASYRCSMTFQKVNQVNSQGAVTLYQPWYGACVAAGMQAAGFYKGITNKFANVISVVDPTDFDNGSPTNIETALLAGLLILQTTNAGVKWVSDQTTYGYDTNFVYNSLQAVYGADIIALDLADSFQSTFVGQSLADISAASGLAYLSNKMNQYYNLKLIAGSSDAPAGYKNAKVSISGGTMTVNVEVKLATTLYFVAIQFVVSEVQQSAG